jgi:hypothetical protein
VELEISNLKIKSKSIHDQCFDSGAGDQHAARREKNNYIGRDSGSGRVRRIDLDQRKTDQQKFHLSASEGIGGKDEAAGKR